MLSGLLILPQLPVRQLDGKQGLDAGVQIEKLTGPAGPDSFGVAMVEAVHSREPIMLGLLLAPEREVQMPGQLLLTHPGLAALPIRFGKYPTIWSLGDADPAIMNNGVVPLAQQDQIANTALRVPSSDLQAGSRPH